MNDCGQVKVSVGKIELTSVCWNFVLQVKCFCAHLLVLCLVLLHRPALGASVSTVSAASIATRFGHSRDVGVPLGTHRPCRLSGFGGRTVHLQAPQLAALEAALVHDAA